MTHIIDQTENYTGEAQASRHDPKSSQKSDDFYHWVYAQVDSLTHQTPEKGQHKDDY